LPTQSEEDVANGRNQNEWHIDIGRDDPTPIGVFVPKLDDKGRHRGYTPLTEEVRHFPPAAAEPGLRVQIEGDLVRTSSRRVVDCEIYDRQTMFGENMGGGKSTCHINVRFRQITFLDAQGHVLAKRND
jgi:hypothetical protein